MIDMKPCPACRSTRVCVMQSLTGTSSAEIFPKVRCLDCCCIGPVAETPEDAVRAWNIIPRAPVQPTKTLRDEFAMAAMGGILASGVAGEWAIGDVSDAAYCYADAMMKEREKADE